MKFCLTIFLLSAVMFNELPAQHGNTGSTSLPYHEIPSYPETYSPGNVAARVLDGLGYRYYWATEGLREEDLAFRPGKDGRSTGETLDHIYRLSLTIANATRGIVNVRSSEEVLTFEQKRKRTLENIQKTSRLLKASQESDMEDYQLIFKSGEQTTSFPFWNFLNGPLADALYHVGQVVAFRRSSGNPINPNVNVFTGKTRN